MLLEIEALNLSLREGGRALLRGINLSLQEGTAEGIADLLAIYRSHCRMVGGM